VILAAYRTAIRTARKSTLDDSDPNDLGPPRRPRRDGIGVAAMCAGAGMSTAVIIEA
jgi:hypothetical protein